MPELPEVEAQRRLLSQAVSRRYIGRAVVAEQGGGPRHGLFDEKVCGGGETQPDEFVRALQGRWVVAVHRKGKQIWLELAERQDGAVCASLLIHFGMTGACLVKGEQTPYYKSFKIDTSEWPPKFTKLELELCEADGALGCSLAYTDPRRFGRLLLRSSLPLESPPLVGLARDPLLDPPSAVEFSEALTHAAQPIKALLLDQACARATRSRLDSRVLSPFPCGCRHAWSAALATGLPM
ncbi:MAG: hypothetical protein SGPRY_014487, partial [Prymnesium sp.]